MTTATPIQFSPAAAPAPDPQSDANAIVGGRVELQLLTTLRCNLKCSYCSLGVGEVLASIDGGEATTDRYRGRGIYRQVMKNLKEVRAKIGGSVTARVTWGNPDTCFEELDQLVGEDTAFDYLYWQFVADEQYGGDSLPKRQAVLVQLIDKFFSRSDVLYPLIPLMGMVRNKLFPNRAQELYAGQAQCRVSTHLLNVMPSGEIYP